jgi:hypothetical protein
MFTTAQWPEVDRVMNVCASALRTARLRQYKENSLSVRLISSTNLQNKEDISLISTTVDYID